jgi:hypothetical protein
MKHFGLCGGMFLAFVVGGVWLPDAQAGLKSSGALVVTTTGARGQFATVRASSDTVQFITCELTTETDSLGAYSTVLCAARSAGGTERACGSDDPEYVAAARGINGDSYIEFEKNSDNDCIRLFIENGSGLRPKDP